MTTRYLVRRILVYPATLYGLLLNADIKVWYLVST